MNELKSYTEYAVSTPTADFVIGFAFNYGEDAVNVTVDDVPATKAGYTVVYLNETIIRLSPSVPSGVVRLQRETDIDQTDHAYRAGAKFVAQTIDENFEQLRHSQQEVRDGFAKLADDTYEIIDTLNEVGQSAQDAADAAEVAAAQVNDKVSYEDFNNKPHNAMLGRDAASAHPTNSILDASGETQQQVNYSGGSKWHSRVGGYQENERVVLANGDIVKSTINGNANDPNVDMTGWVSSNLLHVVRSTAELQTLQPSLNRQIVHTLSFYSGLNKGGASYKYDATKASTNNGTTIFNGWVLVLKPKMNVFQFGAKADGSDDTVFIQSAVNYGIKSLDLPEIFTVTTLQVKSPITIHGVGGLMKTVARDDPLLSVSANDVTINGIHLRGSSYGSTVNAAVVLDNGIFVNGGNTATPIKNLTIKNCKIDGFCGFGVRAEYIKNAKVYGNTILNCGYSGVTLTSAVDSIVVKNRIDNIQSSSGAINWYGISLTRNPLRSLSDSIRSTNCIVANNIVSNVPLWTGIDTHAPYKVLITGNQVYGCKNGIYAQYDSSSAVHKMPAEMVVISDNMVEGTILAGSGYGIASLGLSGMPNDNVIIKNNLIIGCGVYSSLRGAIHIVDTNNADVSSNNITKAVRCGMSLAGTCSNIEIKDNIVNGVRDGSETSSSSYLYVDYRNGLTNCKVSRNKFLSNSTSEYKPYVGIFYDGGGNGVVYDRNRMSDLNSTTFLRKVNGSSNIYTDLKWILEEEVISFNYTTVGGSRFEATGDQRTLFRRLPNTLGTPILISSTLLNQPIANNLNYSIRGNYGGVFTPAVYRLDGTNTIAGVSFNDIVLNVKGVYWTD